MAGPYFLYQACYDNYLIVVVSLIMLVVSPIILEVSPIVFVVSPIIGVVLMFVLSVVVVSLSPPHAAKTPTITIIDKNFFIVLVLCILIIAAKVGFTYKTTKYDISFFPC